MTPTGVLGLEVRARAWVPMDDEHTLAISLGGPPRGVVQVGRQTVGPVETLPNTSDWYGRFRALANKDNDYLVDRKEQKTASFTGIGSIFLQDQAATESMGAIYDRSQEHLGTSDAMIIRTRKRLLDAARALRDNGSAFGRRRAAARLVDGGASNGSSKPPFGGSGCPGGAGGTLDLDRSGGTAEGVSVDFGEYVDGVGTS